jgi:hypothetical protein
LQTVVAIQLSCKSHCRIHLGNQHLQTPPSKSTFEKPYFCFGKWLPKINRCIPPFSHQLLLTPLAYQLLQIPCVFQLCSVTCQIHFANSHGKSSPAKPPGILTFAYPLGHPLFAIAPTFIQTPIPNGRLHNLHLHAPLGNRL